MKRAQIDPVTSVPGTRSRQRVRARDWPRPPRRDPHTRAIAQLLALAGPDSSVIATSSRPWASATFLGAKHTVELLIGGSDAIDRAETFARALPDAEFSISGHIVADACVDEWRMTTGTGDGARDDGCNPATDVVALRLSILTIEDW